MSNNLEEKKARLEAEHLRRQKRKKLVLGSLFGLMVVVIAATILMSQEAVPFLDDKYNIGQNVDYSGKNVSMTTVKAEVGEGKVKLPLAELKKGGIIWAQYDPNKDIGNGQKGLPVMGFITPAGRLLVTVSFCEPCYSRTFHIVDNKLVCDTCGTQWALGDLTGLNGGCVKYPPAQLKYTVDKQTNQVVINETDLKNWHPRDYDPSTTMGAAKN